MRVNETPRNTTGNGLILAPRYFSRTFTHVGRYLWRQHFLISAASHDLFVNKLLRVHLQDE